MKQATVAKRYARALLSIALDSKLLDTVRADLSSLAKNVRQSSDLEQLLNNPRFTAAERGSVVQALAEKLGCDQLTRNFLGLLGDKGRFGELLGISVAFDLLADEQQGRLRAQVRSSAPLMPDELAQIKKSLEQRTGKQVLVEDHVDPSLLGGVVARIGDTVYDSSLRSHLTRLRQGILNA